MCSQVHVECHYDSMIDLGFPWKETTAGFRELPIDFIELVDPSSCCVFKTCRAEVVNVDSGAKQVQLDKKPGVWFSLADPRLRQKASLFGQKRPRGRDSGQQNRREKRFGQLSDLSLNGVYTPLR